MDEKKKEKEIKNAELIIPSFERRVYPRIALSTTIKYVIIDKKENIQEEKHEEILKSGLKNTEVNKLKESETLNLSSSGLLMTTDENIEIGTLLHINMHIPLPGISCNCSILGEVVRNEKKDEKYKIAVKFLKVIHHNLNKYKYSTLKDILNLEGSLIKLD